MRKGIDVSKWQGSIDWNTVSASSIEFAILKADALCTGLTGRLLTVTVSVIENIIASINLDQASVSVSGTVSCIFYICFTVFQ